VQARVHTHAHNTHTQACPSVQALSKLAPHIQQVSMESNGKGVDINGNPLPFEAGEIDFGEPGTNGQHSFYQLIHQVRGRGRVRGGEKRLGIVQALMCPAQGLTNLS